MTSLSSANRHPAAVPVSAERPVVVVEAGPVGMTAAATLAHVGLPVVVVELHPEPRPDWRASTFHAATLELLETIDITGQMHAEGLVVPTYQFRDRRDGLVATSTSACWPPALPLPAAAQPAAPGTDAL